MNLAGGFFTQLDVDQQRAIRSRASLRNVERGAPLFWQGETSSWVYFVVQGHLKLTVGSDGGREALVEVCGAGDMLGAAAWFDGGPHSTSAFALTNPTEVLALDLPAAHNMIASDPRLNAAVRKEFGRKLRVSTERQLELAVDDVSGRVTRRLYELTSRFGEIAADDSAVLKSPITQQDLAAWAGVSRQAVVKELRRLRDDGLIQTRGSRIVISDMRELYARRSAMSGAPL